MKNTLFLLLCMLPLFGHRGQTAVRAEIEAPIRPEGYRIATAGPAGIVAFVEIKSEELGQNQWVFTHYDTALQETWTAKAGIPNWLEYRGYDMEGHTVYMLFTRYTDDLYYFISVDVQKKEVSERKFYSLKKLLIKDLKALDGNVFVSAIAKDAPVLLQFPMKEREANAKILPTSTTKRSEIGALEKDTTDHIVNFSFVHWQGNLSTVVVQSYQADGELISEIAIPRGDKNLLTAKLSITDEGNAMILGTYSSGARKLADGLFIAEYEGPKQRYIKYHNFADLKHFFDYLPEKAQARIEKKQAAKKETNRELSLQYRLLMHDLIVKDGQYLLVAEAYYPTYRYQQLGGMAGGYRAAPVGQMVFDGFQYTHAMLVAFDKSGNLLWDSSFELEQEKYYTLREVVKLGFNGDSLVLAYNQRGDVSSKVIANGKVVSPARRVTLEQQHEALRTFQSELHDWYGPYFLSWGYQRVRDEGKKKSVFFLHRIPFADLY